MTYATTFSGIGGWELGLDACGWELQWQCERDHWCRRLLHQRFGVPIYDDIATIIEHNPRRVDALVGSPPCQPFSVAGRRRGTADDRHLWPSMLRLIAKTKPRWVCVENVTGINGMVLEGMQVDLAAEGYEVGEPLVIPACAVGANHRRDRVWIIAHFNGEREPQQKRLERQKRRRAGYGAKAALAYAALGGWEESEQDTDGSSPVGFAGGDKKAVDHFNIKGSQTSRECNAPARPSETEQIQSTAASFPRFETLGEILREIHGIPKELDRAARIKALGNAVVPRIPYLIGQAINEAEKIAAT